MDLRIRTALKEAMWKRYRKAPKTLKANIIPETLTIISLPIHTIELRKDEKTDRLSLRHLTWSQELKLVSPELIAFYFLERIAELP